MDEPTDLIFCRGVKHKKIFDMCPGFFKNLDQGHDRALKAVFIKYGWKFIMFEAKNMKICRQVRL